VEDSVKILLSWGVAVLAATAAGQDDAKRPDFTGHWTLDVLRSRFNEVNPPKESVWKVEHREPNLKITIVRENSQGKFTDELDLTTDGVEREATIMGVPGKASATWDAEYLVVRTIRATSAGPVETTRRFKLGSKGKILTNVSTVKDKAGEKKAYEFYTRQ
jgi:hypothetical protein